MTTTTKTTRQQRQKPADASDSCARLTARSDLLRLAKIINELHIRHGWSYRAIAELTTRGPRSFGYWQMVAGKRHMGQRPNIRPCVYDLHDIEMIYLVVKRENKKQSEARVAHREFLAAHAAFQQAALRLANAVAQ